ncbi:hypothetical protein H4582DRAFT_2131204 [Lactarius indigo]|nr:hypothetical protein H4582DRAFT_2131204 [Lactarius indigo]
MKRQGLPVAAPNLHSDYKTRATSARNDIPGSCNEDGTRVSQIAKPEPGMIIANRHHTIGDVAGGKAERIRALSHAYRLCPRSLHFRFSSGFPGVLSHFLGQFLRYDVIERREDMMGYGVFRDVFQGDWQRHNVFKPEAIKWLPMQARNQFTVTAQAYQLVLFFTWVVLGMSGQINRIRDRSKVRLCATGALKTPRFSVSDPRPPILSYRIFLYRSSGSPGVVVGDSLVVEYLLCLSGEEQDFGTQIFRQGSSQRSQDNLELSENTVVPAADLPYGGTLTTSAQWVRKVGLIPSPDPHSFVTESEGCLLSAQSGVPAQRGHPV